jgi:hypothetical protein
MPMTPTVVPGPAPRRRSGDQTVIDPADVYPMVIALSMRRSPAAPVIAAAPGDPPAEHDRRRRALAAVTARAFAPGAPRATA